MEWKDTMQRILRVCHLLEPGCFEMGLSLKVKQAYNDAIYSPYEMGVRMEMQGKYEIQRTFCSRMSTTSRRCFASIFLFGTSETASISLYWSASSQYTLSTITASETESPLTRRDKRTFYNA